MMNDVQDQIQAKAAGVVTYRLPSYGIFSTMLETSYWFGMARNVAFAGLNMDHLETQTNSKDNDRAKRINFAQAMGTRASAKEHSVPEQMFSTEKNPVQGISAVKALALAGGQGQKAWTINKENLSIALKNVNLNGDIKAEIRNAVNAGKVATVHEDPVVFGSSAVAGYILIDPDTGAGAYKIAGGLNGGSIPDLPVDFTGFFIPSVNASDGEGSGGDSVWPYILTLLALASSVGGGKVAAMTAGVLLALYLLYDDFQSLNSAYGSCGPEAREIIVGYAIIQIILIIAPAALVGTGGILPGIALLMASLIAAAAVRVIWGYKCA